MDIKEKAKKLPSSPGVYLMKDASNHIIYVGKSKHLKNRVQSYLQHSNHHTKKVERLVDHLKDFDYILTDTEFEAFMLECKLIKELKPMYNRVMKSPKVYHYIKIGMDRPFHSIELANTTGESNCSLYFGPYTSTKTVEHAIDAIKDFYKINCNNPMNHSHTPCFNYSIGKCMGICCDDAAVEKYHHILSKILAFLKGEENSILVEMQQKMNEASVNFDFEYAAKLRESIKAIKSLYQKGKVIEFAKESKNIVVVEFIDEENVKMFLIKGNHILFKKMYSMDEIDFKELCSLIRTNFAANHPSLQELSKDQVDEAQIIYHYLTSNACEYFIVPDEWLCHENQNKLEKAMNELLKLMFVNSLMK